jgi:hypothetical protein
MTGFRRQQKRIPAVTAVLAAFAAISVMLALALPGPSPAATTSDITISADQTTITYGQSTSIAGRLKKQPKPGVKVSLEQLPAPYDGGWKPVGSADTRTNGRYSFGVVEPLENTRYRVTTAEQPQRKSNEQLVEVRYKVVLRLDDRTPRKGQRVRFFGTVGPESDARAVNIQRRTFSGRWRTVKKTVTLDAGDELSQFSTRIRVRRDGTYRARFFHSSTLEDGTSRPKRAFVH